MTELWDRGQITHLMNNVSMFYAKVVEEQDIKINYFLLGRDHKMPFLFGLNGYELPAVLSQNL